MKAKEEENSDGSREGWLYCAKRGQSRSPKLPHFDWTGYISMTFAVFDWIAFI